MTQTFESIIAESKNELSRERQVMIDRRFVMNIDADSFMELLKIEATKAIVSKNIDREFEINDQNRKIIEQLFLYCTKNKEFNGDLNKGILLAGKNGIGKTIILSAISAMFLKLSRKVFKEYHSKVLAQIINKEGIGAYIKKPLFVDDIGKEQRESMNYGNRTQPIPDLMAIRYDNGALTLATTNYNIDTLSGFYGVTTTDRFKEMFNIFVMTGESYRK